VTRRSAKVETLPGVAQSTSFGMAVRSEVQPLRTLTEFARSIFEAAWDLLEESGDLVKS